MVGPICPSPLLGNEISGQEDSGTTFPSPEESGHICCSPAQQPAGDLAPGGHTGFRHPHLTRLIFQASTQIPGSCCTGCLFKMLSQPTLTSVVLLVGHHPANKGRRFDSQSGHMPGLQVQSLVGCVQEAIDRCFSPSLSPSLPLSLKINKLINK